ncbi:unnamed protein product [Closterium sp. Naga37s-1]|nr:unnamed protein product [Closterium sp. Naga37s-1]
MCPHGTACARTAQHVPARHSMCPHGTACARTAQHAPARHSMCPHGINAAFLGLSMHTRHTHPFPPPLHSPQHPPQLLFLLPLPLLFPSYRSSPVPTPTPLLFFHCSSPQSRHPRVPSAAGYPTHPAWVWVRAGLCVRLDDTWIGEPPSTATSGTPAPATVLATLPATVPDMVRIAVLATGPATVPGQQHELQLNQQEMLPPLLPLRLHLQHHLSVTAATSHTTHTNHTLPTSSTIIPPVAITPTKGYRGAHASSCGHSGTECGHLGSA